MLKFENTHVFTGYLKQLLADFNLPKYRVYTKENAKYFKENGKESPEIIETIPKYKNNQGNIVYPADIRYVNYIKNNDIQRYVNGEWVSTRWHYHYNKKELNQTKNLVVKSNVYDSYTHEYLGDFLRFQRDYNDLDLMPLYNCFSNVLCPSLKINFTNTTIASITQEVDDSDSDSDSDDPEYITTDYHINKNISFDTSDPAYKIYMLPVKIFKKYTIAIDCPSNVEICCGFYGDYYDTRDKFANVPKCTYKKFNSLKFSAPVIYDSLVYDNLLNSLSLVYTEDTTALRNRLVDLTQYEHELKMFIKVPANTNSTITILEGDYSGYNQSIYNKKWVNTPQGYIIDLNSAFETRRNKFVFNFDVANIAVLDDDSDDEDILSEADVVVTELPDYEDRPFIPYTELQLLQANSGTSYPFADRLIEYLLYNVITPIDEVTDNIRRVQKVMELNNNTFAVEGAWEPKIRLLVYDYMTSKHPDYPITGIDPVALKDSLGYIDKDVEKYYTAWRVEYVRDANGNKVQLKDKDGNPIFVPIHEIITALDDNGKRLSLRELYKKILRETGEVVSEEPVYKTVNIPVATISNVDLYPDMYKDSKQGGKK